MTEIRVSIGQYSSAGQKERNDDSYGVIVPNMPQLATKGVAMAIADGMGSSEGAKTASETCIRSFLEDYYSTHDSWAVKTSAGRVLTAVNRWLHSQSQSQYGCEDGLVTTFSGLVLKAGTGYVFHAGDSRISLVRDGRLDVLTQSHRVQMPRGREYLARAVGRQPDLVVDYREVAIEDGDILVFTTDGVHEFLEPRRMLDLLAQEAEPNAAAEIIAEAAAAAGSPDNLTCQIVRVECAGKLDPFTLTQRLQALPFPPDLSPGMVFEGHRIIRELHASKRSQVYLSRDEETGSEVVIKTPSVNFEDDPDYIRQFIREEWVGQLISSPHVLKVFASQRPRRYLYTLTEAVTGETLRSWMDRNPRPGIEAFRGIIDQIIKGLRAFHRNDILHQDLKPDNIMIAADGTVKIIDFGSVRVAGLEELRGAGAMPAQLGTREYSAPEYLRGEPPTSRADLFSLGVIAYEMLTGAHPYGSGFLQAAELTRARYVPASSLNPDIPAWMDAALKRAVMIQPSQRYEALSEFMVDLTKPNGDFVQKKGRVSLYERNPDIGLKLLLILSVVLNVALAFLLHLRG